MPLTFLTDTSIHQVLEVFISKSPFQSLFPEYDDIVEGELPQFEISDIKFEQTIEAPLTPTDTATLSGNKNPPTSCLSLLPDPGHVATKNGTGGGGVGLCVRRIGDNGAWQELEVHFVLSKLHQKLKRYFYRQVLATAWCVE